LLLKIARLTESPSPTFYQDVYPPDDWWMKKETFHLHTTTCYFFVKVIFFVKVFFFVKVIKKVITQTIFNLVKKETYSKSCLVNISAD